MIHNMYLLKIQVDLMRKLIIKGGHNFVHVTAAELSWHVQIWDLIVSTESWYKHEELS